MSLSRWFRSPRIFLLVYQRVVAHWRAIILLLILPCVVFLEARFDEFARFDLILLASGW